MELKKIKQVEIQHHLSSVAGALHASQCSRPTSMNFASAFLAICSIALQSNSDFPLTELIYFKFSIERISRIFFEYIFFSPI